MNVLPYIADIGAGLFLCNCIPHLAAGLQGRPFPTPFARPPGFGNSSPLANFLWGLFNVLAGTLLLSYAPFAVGFNLSFMLFTLGGLVLGIYLSGHFGAVRQGRP
jgi:hypothetical protein